jgi:hypothetical protein
MAMFFEKKLEEVKAARKQAVYITDVLRLQIEHFEEKGIKFPFDAKAELKEAEKTINEFDRIYQDKSGSFKERGERKVMIAGYKPIFDELNAKINGFVNEMHDCFIEQFPAK